MVPLHHLSWNWGLWSEFDKQIRHKAVWSCWADIGMPVYLTSLKPWVDEWVYVSRCRLVDMHLRLSLPTSSVTQTHSQSMLNTVRIWCKISNGLLDRCLRVRPSLSDLRIYRADLSLKLLCIAGVETVTFLSAISCYSTLIIVRHTVIHDNAHHFPPNGTPP